MIVVIGNKLGAVGDIAISPDNSLSISFGIGLLIMSMIFRYGAGLEGKVS